MKKILLVVGFCFQLFAAAAQSFEPGYIVHHDQDTIFGFILEAPDSELATGINFRIDPETLPEYFAPGEIQAFGFNNGRSFYSMSIPETEITSAIPVFAKNLIKGKIDLYIYSHPQRYKPDFFIINNSTGEEAYLQRPAFDLKYKKEKEGKKFADDWKNNLRKILEDSTAISEDMRYSEKKIKRTILEYNRRFEKNFPVELYRYTSAYDISVLAGVPIRFDNNFKTFRAAIFIEKYNPEQRNNFLITRGVIYHQNRDSKEIPEGLENGEFLYENKLLNIIPIAIKFQGDPKVVQPYGYLGVGAAVSWEKSVVVENEIASGVTEDTKFLPTVNVGIGAKIRSGSQAFIAEFTPTLNGVFLNIGYSF